MCQPCSMIAVKGRKTPYWSDKTDSHEEIIKEFGLYDGGLVRDANLVRVEIVPPDNDWTKPFKEWEYILDELKPPAWYDSAEVEQSVRAELPKWFEKRVIINDRETLSDGLWIIAGKAIVQYVQDQATVQYVQDQATVECVSDSATVEYVRDRAIVQYVQDQVTVQYVQDQATVQNVRDRATVHCVRDRATVECVSGSATVQNVRDQATVQNVGGSATVQNVRDRATVHCVRDRATVHCVRDQATVIGYNGKVPELQDSAVYVDRFNHTLKGNP